MYGVPGVARCLVLAGYWTPEAAAEQPAAIEQLATEYSRCGADVTQTFTFQAAALQGASFPPDSTVTTEEVNMPACAIAGRVRASRGGLVAGGLTQTGLYTPCITSKEETQAIYRRNLTTLVAGGVDFIILEFFQFITEMEWAIEAAVETGLPVGAMLCMGPDGEEGGASVELSLIHI